VGPIGQRSDASFFDVNNLDPRKTGVKLNQRNLNRRFVLFSSNISLRDTVVPPSFRGAPPAAVSIAPWPT
jgi:hypothetical protein